jgi:microcystin-dependent protein
LARLRDLPSGALSPLAPGTGHISTVSGWILVGEPATIAANGVSSSTVGTPFLAEIRIMSLPFPPRNWADCNGQFLPINQNQALFALLGTMYGGNGQTNFALPDLRGRVAMHVGSGFVQGQTGGETAHTLTISELPTHTHAVTAQTGDATTNDPAGNRLAVENDLYAAPANAVALVPSAVTNMGGSQAHENRQPFLGLRFCIAITAGIFPSQT